MIKFKGFRHNTAGKVLASCLGMATIASGTLVACGSSVKVDPQQAATVGTVSLSLTAQGASGATYRLRFGDYDILNLTTGDLYFESSESNPEGVSIQAVLPSGEYRIELLEGWSMEKLTDGNVAQVSANLVSDRVQLTTVRANDSTRVLYSFDVGDEVLQFGEGELKIDIDLNEVAGGVSSSSDLSSEFSDLSRGSVIETNQAALGAFTLRDTLDAALANSGRVADGELAYRTLIDSYASIALATEATASHCDDQMAEGGGFGLNGFPLACERMESQQTETLDQWFPIAVVNRFDLAPATGADCGQQRIIFANNAPIGNGRMFIILEAVVPNPDPTCGVGSCFPIAEFWASVAGESDPVVRGERLRAAFISGGGVDGFAPFMNADYLGPVGGQVRTNNFNSAPWSLREFHFDSNLSPALRPVPVAGSPAGLLWDDSSSHSAGPECRQAFLAGVSGLLGDNLSTMSFEVPEQCKNAESRNDFSEHYPMHLNNGAGEFAAELDQVLSGTGLNAVNIAARARFAGSCIGCHQEASGSDLGNSLQAPDQFDFVHVNERSLETCENEGLCFSVSDALRNHFLPHRQSVLESALQRGPACVASMPLQPEGETVRAVRTLGGQVANRHGH